VTINGNVTIDGSVEFSAGLVTINGNFSSNNAVLDQFYPVSLDGNATFNGDTGIVQYWSIEGNVTCSNDFDPLLFAVTFGGQNNGCRTS
jgi:hypothetical protein